MQNVCCILQHINWNKKKKKDMCFFEIFNEVFNVIDVQNTHTLNPDNPHLTRK